METCTVMSVYGNYSIPAPLRFTQWIAGSALLVMSFGLLCVNITVTVIMLKVYAFLAAQKVLLTLFRSVSSSIAAFAYCE